MKSATVWTRTGSGETLPTNAGFGLLLEDGFNLLLEDNGEFLLEDNVYNPKADSVWTSETKQATIWGTTGRGEPSLDNLGVERTTESGSVRTTESGTTRTLEDVSIIFPSRTVWSENND